MVSLNAFIKTLEFYKKENVIKNMLFGQNLKSNFNTICNDLNLSEVINMDGLACSPFINFNYKNNNLRLKTFFQQEMIKKNIIIPWISISYRHGTKELNKTLNASYDVLKKIKVSLRTKGKFFIKGKIIKPIFKKFMKINKTILIVGSEGLIGQALKKRKLEQRYDVICIDIKKKGKNKLLFL